MRKLISLLIAGALLVTGCGLGSKFRLFGQEKPRYAVVDWDKLVREHPKYKAWQKKQEALETARTLRDRQLKNGRQQLAMLNKMKQLTGSGQSKFRQARLAARMAEKQAQEQDMLRKKEESLMDAAEQYVQADRNAVEERFRIPLFNIRLKLGSIKMTEASQKALLQEEQELLDARRKAIQDIEDKKRAWLREQLAEDYAASRERMNRFASELMADTVREETGLDLNGMEKNQPGQQELDKLIASMDTQIQSQENAQKKMRDEIDSDILSAIKKVNLTKKYTLVFRNPRANISADDITDEVNIEVKKIVY
jgi:energy-coupling factor transporter ATP-binding protein EcfA2